VSNEFNQQAMFETLTLEYLEMGVNMAVSRGELLRPTTPPQLQSMAAMYADQMVASLVFAYAGMKHTYSFRHPATWWEMFKERFYPAWALKRWPVRYAAISVDAWRLWSDLPKHVRDVTNRWGCEVRVVIPRKMDPRFMWGE
jgi:hypothetical protein